MDAIYQYQRCVVKRVPSIDVDSSCNHLLACLQITPPTCIAEFPEFRTGVQWAVIPQDPFANKIIFVLKLNFKLVFAKRHVDKNIQSLWPTRSSKDSLAMRMIGDLNCPPSNGGKSPIAIRFGVHGPCHACSLTALWLS